MHDTRLEPIAIVGIGCRFPGAENPRAFWHLLREGRSAIREVPDDRWKPDALYTLDPTQPEKTVSRWGGFLDAVDKFDWRAFRFPPREIKFMDPQHRLLLEVGWEALEDAGLPFNYIAGSRTGVFMGVMWHDYLHLQVRNWSRLDGYTATGNLSSVAANRLSYFFDLKGPSFSLEAACTSSLASVYLACQSLWSGETELALAGGVNLMLSPDTMILVSRTGMLSSDEYSRVLDARADGFLRGEGAGVVVLRPLSKVQPSDQVYALIRGIGSNHNGHNEWMIAPSEAAQRALLQEVYEKAGVDPARVGYVELQGTGFRHGDSVEIRALGAVLGASPQRSHPCLVGSVKTNIGHLEAASGIASLIKVALALHHREIPPTLNLETVNPEIPLAELHILAQQEHGPWPQGDAPPLAGVTTLALTGANAHAVLEAFPCNTNGAGSGKEAGRQLRVLPLSARSKEALRAQVAAMRDFLWEQARCGEMRWQDICYTAGVRRTHHEFRCAVVADSSLQAANALDKLLEKAPGDLPAYSGKSQGRRPIFLLAHGGIQWSDVNTELLLSESVARSVIDKCNLIFTNITHRPLFTDSAHASEFSTSTYAIISFAFQSALAALWRSWGVVPEAVAGEGSGEVAAAYIAGALSLEEAIQVILSGFSRFKKSETEQDICERLSTRATAIPCYSASRGLLGEGRKLVVSHWEKQFKNPELDINAIDQLLTHDVFISLGPPSALPGAILTRLQYHERQGIVLKSLGASEKPVTLETLSNLYSLGSAINWPAMYTGEEKCVSLPAYCWQRERFWLDDMDVDTISTSPERQAGRAQGQHLDGLRVVAGANDSVEEVLTRLWADVLGLDKVHAHDSFFELGGHSLLAGRLLARIQNIFEVRITLEELLQSPTPASCAGLVAGRKSTSAGENASLVELPALVSRPEERYQPFPTTDVQQAYWLGRKAIFELGNVGNHGYIEVEAADFNVQRLQGILQRLIERHEMLRAVMLPDGRQRILEQVPAFGVEIEDLQALPAPLQEQRLLEVRQQMDHELLPLEEWPAFRIRVSRLSPQRLRLHLSVESLFIDAWSMHILIQEFIRLYGDPEAELGALEISFRDYVLAEQRVQEHPSFQRAQAYWTQRLATLPPAPELPLARTPTTLQQPHFVHYESRLAATLWHTLKARGAQAGLTPSGILLAAFAHVLAAWSKTAHFCLNLTLFRRLPLHSQINALVGDFTSLTLLEVDCRGQRSFEERARLLQEQLWRDLDHSDYSGVRVLRDLTRVQGGKAGALMPVVFTSLLVQDTGSAYRAPWQETIYCVTQTPQVWLDHQVLEQHGDLVFHWQVVEELFPPGLIPTLFEAYCQFLLRLAHSDQCWLEPVRDLLPALQLRTRQQRNATSCPRPDHLLLHTPVLQQAALRPDDLAVITPSRRLSYRELHTGAALLAHELRQAGARSDQLVAVVMEKGWEQVVAVLGVLLAGAAYVPIDPTLPPERLLLLMAQSEVEQVLTQSWLDRSLSWPPTIRRLCVDSLDLEAPDPPLLSPTQSPEDLAYVIYTSGSTGVPKGVMIEHRSAVNTILDLNRRFSISPHDRVLGLSALNFDLSVYDIFGTLAAGGAIVLPEGEEAARDPQIWLDLLRDERVTLWNTVPALLQILVEYAESHPSALTGLRLRLAYLSGDWIPLALPDRARALLPNLQVISMGGATEASIWSIIYPVATVEAGWISIPYGWPMENQSWEILNERLEEVPDWVVGQLYIGGMGLARGYWRDEEKTASRFVPHPRTSERLYRTGDLGRYWPDGSIEFLGREDFQVKVQGYRIELGEIEVTLRRHPSIEQAVVIVADASHDGKRLLAYVVPKPGSSLSPGTLHTFLKERLPGYMVPSSLLLLDTLPLTANGKVDRKALLALSTADATSSTQTPAVETTLLARITQVIESVLGVHSLAPEANLLEYGATSVSIIRIINLLEKDFHCRPRLNEFFHFPTIMWLAIVYEQHLLQSQEVKGRTGEEREEGDL